MQLKGGNVGIGTTNPGQKLDVNGAIRANSSIVTSSSGANWFGLEPEQGETPAHSAIVNWGNDRLRQFQMGAPYTSAFSGALVVGSNNTETSNVPTNGLYSLGGAYFGGNVGIGTTAPTAALDVNGTASFSGGLGTIIYSTQPASRFVPAAGNTWYYTGESLTITVPAGPSRRYRLVMRQSIGNTTSSQEMIDLSTSSSSDSYFFRLHRVANAGWDTLSGETYVTLAGGTTTSYYVWVYISAISNPQLGNATTDNRTYSDFYAVPM